MTIACFLRYLGYGEDIHFCVSSKYVCCRIDSVNYLPGVGGMNDTIVHTSFNNFKLYLYCKGTSVDLH